jgi:hypothetical protein
MNLSHVPENLDAPPFGIKLKFSMVESSNRP